MTLTLTTQLAYPQGVISPISDIRVHGGVRVSWQDYQGPFHRWNGDKIPFIVGGGMKCVYLEVGLIHGPLRSFILNKNDKREVLKSPYRGKNSHMKRRLLGIHVIHL